MQAVQVQDYARRLIEVHGERAGVEAAQKAVELEKAGDQEQAQLWRRIEAAVGLMRGPRQA